MHVERRAGRSPESGSRRPLRILFVEDSEFDYQMLGRLLRQGGLDFQAYRVEDEAGMRAALTEENWDVVISDHHLPQFDAKRALGVFNEYGFDAPFLIVSGSIGEELAVDAMLHGADDYVLKSNLGRLVPAIRRSLGTAQVRRKARESEAARGRSEALLQSITSNFPGVVFRIAVDVGRGVLKFEYMSPGALRLMGIGASEVMADVAAFLGILDSRDRAALRGALLDSGSVGNAKRWQGRYRDPRFPQEERWLEMACTETNDEPGNVVWEGVAIDITAQKSAQQELASSREALRSLSHHIETVREDERKALARELHDDVGGMLAGIRLELDALKRELGPRNESLMERINGISMFVEGARVSCDQVMRSLRPSVIDLGIEEALSWLVRDLRKRHAIALEFGSSGDASSVPEPDRVVLFRVCQEALLNAVKHARATQVRVDLFAGDDLVTLEIADNGIGIAADRASAADRFGIRGMRERVEARGGWLEVAGALHVGTSLMVALPLNGVPLP